MRTAQSYATLEQLGRLVVTTREASVALGLDPSAATHALTRLAEVGLVRRLRHGVWQIGGGTLDPLLVLPALTQPYPSYVSLWSALFGHGMIGQIPRSVYAVSLGRARSVKTEAGEFRIHHVTPDLYGGAEVARAYGLAPLPRRRRYSTPSTCCRRVPALCLFRSWCYPTASTRQRSGGGSIASRQTVSGQWCRGNSTIFLWERPNGRQPKAVPRANARERDATVPGAPGVWRRLTT